MPFLLDWRAVRGRGRDESVDSRRAGTTTAGRIQSDREDRGDDDDDDAILDNVWKRGYSRS